MITQYSQTSGRTPASRIDTMSKSPRITDGQIQATPKQRELVCKEATVRRYEKREGGSISKNRSCRTPRIAVSRVSPK
jgi:hypothetical protein